jgi:hypothetical protein
VGPRTGLGMAVKRKNSQPLPGLEPLIIQPVAQHYTTELSRFLDAETVLWKSEPVPFSYFSIHSQ